MDRSPNWQKISRIVGPCIRPGGHLLTERALELCSIPPGSRIADIGCGAGGTLEYLERTGDYSLVGLDCSESLLRNATTRLKTGCLIQSRAELLPFKQGAFDALFCECVLSTLVDRTTALGEFARVIDGNGFLIVSDVLAQDHPGQTGLGGESQCISTNGFLAKSEILELLKRFGFSIFLWEEHERLAKEFAARMILAGAGLPDGWGCGPKQNGKNPVRLIYFLLLARKSAIAVQSIEN
ncbi:MAG: methyltransferase domain-containing protein [Sterolibacterium sp.]|nr:methyltransferase domain-containing protein [Sterolibacterium sp.]